MAQLVVLRVPQEVEQEQLVLPRVQAAAAADHLRVEAADLGGTRSTTMQSTDGQSQPSVNSMELHSTPV